MSLLPVARNDALYWAVAGALKKAYHWLVVLKNHQIRLEDVYVVEIETQPLEDTESMLLYLVASTTLEE